MNRQYLHSKTSQWLMVMGIVLTMSTATWADDFDQKRLKEIEKAYKSGVLTQEDYEFKKGLIEKAIERSKGLSTSPTIGKIPSSITDEYTGPNRRFQAEDKSFMTRVPLGWRPQIAVVNYRPAYIFAPPREGEDKVAVGSGVTTAKDIEELAQQTIAWTNKAFPFLKQQGAARFTDIEGHQAVLLSYEGTTPQGQPVRAWNGVILKGIFFYSVLSAADPSTADRVEQKAKYILHQLRPNVIPENHKLAQALVGRWTYYESSNSGVGSTRSGGFVNKQVTFTADQRFEYVGGVYLDSNLPGGGGGTVNSHQSNSGTFNIYGNQLLAKLPDGSEALFGLELIADGGIKINGAMFLKE